MGTVLASVGFGTVIGFPTPLWTLLNTIDLFAYLALATNPLTPRLKSIFQGFGQYNPVFNVPKQLI